MTRRDQHTYKHAFSAMNYHDNCLYIHTKNHTKKRSTRSYNVSINRTKDDNQSALHRVLGPRGPQRHWGVSVDPQFKHTVAFPFRTAGHTQHSMRVLFWYDIDTKVMGNIHIRQKRKSHAISQFSAPAEYGNRKSLSGVSHQTKTLQGEAEVASAHLKKTQKGTCTVSCCRMWLLPITLVPISYYQNNTLILCCVWPAVRKGKATVCLNCGSTETPQWRCGPLGPRTLCNACGVRYKKGLPLSCWPLRNGMILPPGAELPPNIIVPEGMTIVTQPARQY
jgi:hypothetical protein